MKYTITIFTLALALTACQKGQPEISVLRSLKGFSLTQTSALIKDRTPRDFRVTGTCDSQISDVLLSYDGGASYVSAASLSSFSLINCASSGTFEFVFSTSQSNLALAASEGTKNLLFRGSGDLGQTDPQSYLLTMPQGWHMVTAGSAALTDNGYKLTGRLRPITKAENNGYTLTGGLHQE